MCHIAFGKIALKNDRLLAIAISYLHYNTKCELWSGKAPINRSTNHILCVLYHKHYGVGIVLPQSLSPVARGDYSASEVNTGRKWVDGKDIYRKTINIGQLPNATAKQVSHGISHIGTLVSLSGVAQTADRSQLVPLPYLNTNNVGYGITAFIINQNIIVETGYNRSSMTGYVTIEYTKA